ncbi:hypothetical protein PUV54_04510 [Hyphococcus flavus]|uniref:Lipoprotein n=1 Tax=Hyphococcus flavus TaxID=1866326 RepID=A0AAF0CC34_9PROT|nr:hypothetical protein [Hyphococcus flavus]WDI32455.1 hypothetical protein PUV54_04510 [Hyphococcus flavus]
MMNKLILLIAAFSLAACATVSPRKRIENRLMEFGLSEDKAECMGNELDDRLDRGDMKAVADFIGNINAASSPGEGLDALLSIDNARAAGAIARSSVACAFR